MSTAARILIVEDNHLVAADLSETVMTLGHDVVGVSDSGEEAVQMARETTVDLALMDIQLCGKIDGVTAAERIIAFRRTPIIFLSAHGDKGTLGRTTASGASGHLTKPIRKNELEAAISIALRQHRSSSELLEQKAWLANLVSSIHEGIIASDAEGRVNFLNPQAERMTGWTLDEAYGRPVEEVYGAGRENAAEGSELRIRAASRTGRHFPAERVTLRMRNGAEFVIEEIVAPLEDEGIRIGAASIIRDMREAMRVEQAQKFETIGILAGGVAHDFNNLLAIMVGNASLAMESIPPASREYRFLDDVLRSGKKAAELTAQLLAYAGKGTLRKTLLNPGTVVREIVDLVRAAVSPHIALSVNTAPDLPSIEADASQIQQVVMNLVINAAEAIGASQGVIEISVNPGETGDRVLLRVRDSGPGMDPQVRGKIFDPFFTTKFTGRGLGLAAVHGIVKSHGGDIEVEASPGKGATFTITFPASAHRLKPISVPKTAPARGGDETILVVDDLENVRQYVKTALERYGYRVLAVAGGPDAIDLMDRQGDQISLILLDMTMPMMSGANAWRRIREIHPRVPICVMTGYSEAVAAEDLAEADLEHCFLQKPFTPEELGRKVRDMLDATGKIRRGHGAAGA